MSLLMTFPYVPSERQGDTEQNLQALQSPALSWSIRPGILMSLLSFEDGSAGMTYYQPVTEQTGRVPQARSHHIRWRMLCRMPSETSSRLVFRSFNRLSLSSRPHFKPLLLPFAMPYIGPTSASNRSSYRTRTQIARVALQISRTPVVQHSQHHDMQT